MNDDHLARIAKELGLTHGQVRAAAELLDEGSTVPFIARYRKEATGSLDEVAITAIRERLTSSLHHCTHSRNSMQSLKNSTAMYRHKHGNCPD